MDGALTENLYNWPSEDQTDIPPEANKMMCQRKKEYTRGQVAYINGINFISLILHFLVIMQH